MKKKKAKPTKSITLNHNSGWGVLVFPLPDEQDAYDDARLGGNLRRAISEFYNKSLRARLKHGDFSKLENQLLDTIKREFFDCIAEYEAGDVI